MALVINKSKCMFDLQQISRGNLIYAKHSSWDKGRAGFVTSVTENTVIVQYRPEIGNITNHFSIHAVDVMNGKWEVRWSEDLTEIYSYDKQEGE